MCFHSCRYQNQNVPLMSQSCRLCRNRATFVLLVLHSCLTRVALSCMFLTRVMPVSLVSYSCCSYLTLVLWNRLGQVSNVGMPRLFAQVRSRSKNVKFATFTPAQMCSSKYLGMEICWLDVFAWKFFMKRIQGYGIHNKALKKI